MLYCVLSVAKWSVVDWRGERRTDKRELSRFDVVCATLRLPNVWHVAGMAAHFGFTIGLRSRSSRNLSYASLNAFAFFTLAALRASIASRKAFSVFVD